MVSRQKLETIWAFLEIKTIVSSKTVSNSFLFKVLQSAWDRLTVCAYTAIWPVVLKSNTSWSMARPSQAKTLSWHGILYFFLLLALVVGYWKAMNTNWTSKPHKLFLVFCSNNELIGTLHLSEIKAIATLKPQTVPWGKCSEVWSSIFH